MAAWSLSDNEWDALDRLSFSTSAASVFRNPYWERRGWEVVNVCSFIVDFANRNEPVDSRFVRASDLEDIRLWFSTVVLADKLQKRIGLCLAKLTLKLLLTTNDTNHTDGCEEIVLHLFIRVIRVIRGLL
jgi:hypothetical protein